MKALITTTPRASATAGLIVCAVLLGGWLYASTADGLGLLSFLARFVHVTAAIVWVGMIWFVNFVQLTAIESADDTERAAILKLIAPSVATLFRHASHLALLSGFVLLLTTGYMLDRWVFVSAVYVPPAKAILLWLGTIGAITMWGIVHLVLWPSLRIVTGQASADTESKIQARNRIRTYARINLVLALPVTFAMVAAAHLY